VSGLARGIDRRFITGALTGREHGRRDGRWRRCCLLPARKMTASTSALSNSVPPWSGGKAASLCKPQARHFPAANRDRSALSLGVVRRSCPASGSLNHRTAREQRAARCAAPYPRAAARFRVLTVANPLSVGRGPGRPMPGGHRKSRPGPATLPRKNTRSRNIAPTTAYGTGFPMVQKKPVRRSSNPLCRPELSRVDEIVRQCQFNRPCCTDNLLGRRTGQVVWKRHRGKPGSRLFRPCLSVPHVLVTARTGKRTHGFHERVVGESPSQGQDASNPIFLVADLPVLASMGHIRMAAQDLVRSVRMEDFEMELVGGPRPRNPFKAIGLMRFDGAQTVYLATDPDREAKRFLALSSNCCANRGLLDGIDVQARGFHEITKGAVPGGLQSPKRGRP